MRFCVQTICFVTAIALICGAAVLADNARADEAEAIRFFESRIRPVLVRHCYECHSHAAKEPKAGLLLDWREGMRQGGETGPAVVPGKVDESLLIEALRHESFEMPPEKRLPDEVIADFVKWIETGAADPRDAPPDAQAAADAVWREAFQERLEWWSLQPVVAHPAPAVKQAGWSNEPLDRFILARLEAAGLQPAPPADRQTLIRRLHFVLLGLPPNPADVEAFVNDPSPNAYEQLVERLLASPHFGERWARHWMDVVRYADTYGYEWDIPAKGAWRYRDYLIRAFNEDVPFDQLVREQIAGDLLEQPRINWQEHINESRMGPMFFQLGEKRHGDSSEFNGIHQEMLDNKIDAFSKAFQATTVACARCHDHKIDAVAQREYYALAGAFMSSRWVSNTVDLPQRNEHTLAELRAIKTELRPMIAALWLEETKLLAQDLLAASQAPNGEAAGGTTVDSARAARINHWRELLAERQKSKPPLEDPLHAWEKIVDISQSNGDVEKLWSELASQYSEEAKKRTSENVIHFKLAVDFRQGIPEGWSVDGVGLNGITPCGDFTVALEGESAVGQLLPGGLFTNALSPRLNGAVRTPYLNQFSSGHISFECCGGDFAAQRTVFDNAFLTEKQTYLARNEPGWSLMSTLNSMKDRRIYIEFATKTSNPNFPPRVGLGGACSDEQIADPRSWFGISRVVLHEAGHTPVDELARFAGLFEGEPAATLETVTQRYAGWFERAVRAWADNRASADAVALINWLLVKGVLSNRHDTSNHPQIADLVARYRQVEKLIAIPWTVNGMADIDAGYDYRLNLRGDYDQLGDAIPRGYLSALMPTSATFASPRSGRRELAEAIASPDNPLTARVFVNRMWHCLFGTGIVDTPSDFGRLGGEPSHPELLDYLAARFVAEGWSVKKLIREIVLSQTWRQSGQITELARSVDPKNRLWHHFPLRRLEAEELRDAMLVASGEFDARLYGPPQNPYRAKEDSQKRLFSGPIGGDGRRSIYTKVTIMEPARLMATFNAPDPKIPTGNRDVTNTPAQSLTLLNDPFVNGQAGHWANHLVKIAHADVSQRLIYMFEIALSRTPTLAELQRWKSAVTELAELHGTLAAEIMSNAKVWQDVAHALFNLKEFLYYR